LRGPQGTLFGKNTTSGAINITTRKPSFKPGASFEVSYGNYGYIQAKASVTGALSKKFAARLSFSGTQRDGVIENVRTGKYTNDINNLAFVASYCTNHQIILPLHCPWMIPASVLMDMRRLLQVLCRQSGQHTVNSMQ
jgi:outer membrane receptor protein involved in Fe transport